MALLVLFSNKPTKEIIVLRQLIIGTSNADDNGVRHIQKYARTNGIPMAAVLSVIEEAMKRRDALIAGAKKANAESGCNIVVYEDKYAETDDQRFNFAPEQGYLILCPHAEPIGKVIDGQFIPRMKTCWESDGTDGPVVLTAPPKGWDVIEA